MSETVFGTTSGTNLGHTDILVLDCNANATQTLAMKSSTLPSLRVEPELREAVEQLLTEGETVSGFVETSVRAQVEHRRIRAEFLRRGLTALANFERTGSSVPAETVHRKLEARLKQARRDRKG